MTNKTTYIEMRDCPISWLVFLAVLKREKCAVRRENPIHSWLVLIFWNHMKIQNCLTNYYSAELEIPMSALFSLYAWHLRAQWYYCATRWPEILITCYENEFSVLKPLKILNLIYECCRLNLSITFFHNSYIQNKIIIFKYRSIFTIDRCTLTHDLE